MIKKLVEASVDGAKVLDLCIEGDKLIEEGTAAVYNKAVKGVKVTKGVYCDLLENTWLYAHVLNPSRLSCVRLWR